jgi:hypothetical protein
MSFYLGCQASAHCLDNAQHHSDVVNVQSVRNRIPYIDHGIPCDRQQEIFPIIMAGLNLTRYNRLWETLGVRSHFKLSYLCMSPEFKPIQVEVSFVISIHFG